MVNKENKEIMTDDDMYWELLEEQHAHDVVISGADGETDERFDIDTKTVGD